MKTMSSVEPGFFISNGVSYPIPCYFPPFLLPPPQPLLSPIRHVHRGLGLLLHQASIHLLTCLFSKCLCQHCVRSGDVAVSKIKSLPSWCLPSLNVSPEWWLPTERKSEGQICHSLLKLLDKDNDHFSMFSISERRVWDQALVFITRSFSSTGREVNVTDRGGNLTVIRF